jgi:3-oxoadipate enol-lactonase
MLADDIDAVLAANGIESVHFIGLSIGAMIGQAFALRQPKKVMTLLLCEAPPAALENAHAIWEPRVRAVEAAGSVAPVAENTMERWLTDGFRRRQPERWKQIFDTVAATTPDGYRGCVAALSCFDFTADLPRVDAPALVICGEDDPATSLEENERLASLLSRGRFHRFSGARHLPNVEDPERFNAILINWLTEHM